MTVHDTETTWYKSGSMIKEQERERGGEHEKRYSTAHTACWLSQYDTGQVMKGLYV